MRISPVLSLVRWKLSLAVAASALAVFFFFHGGISSAATSLFFGIALLAGAGSAINQIQEKQIDSLMPRTKTRPLPSGSLTRGQAAVIAFVLAPAGSLLLYYGTTPEAVLIGLTNLVLYNGVYTPLKKRTSFAVLIGGVSGALPPVIGCVAAGGIPDKRVFGIAVFIYMWQIGHFLLLLLKFGKEYQQAGIRTLLSLVNENGFKNTLFIWIMGTAASAMLFPVLGVTRGVFMIVLVTVSAIWFVVFFYYKLFWSEKGLGASGGFHFMYIFQGIVLVLITAQGVFAFL
jgi:protoheme IX farnesyltransferase